MVNTRFTHCLFNLLGITRTDRFNLRKTNAANEGLVGRLLYGRLVLGGGGQTYCHTHSNSLSNKMDNSLLDVRGINHKYIVVGGRKKMIASNQINVLKEFCALMLCGHLN